MDLFFRPQRIELLYYNGMISTMYSNTVIRKKTWEQLNIAFIP